MLVELQIAAPAQPAFLAIVGANDPVSPVKRAEVTEDLVGEIGGHRFPVIRVYEGEPALHRPFERGIDPEDRVETRRADPAFRGDVQRERADPREGLHLVEQVVA